MTTQTITPKWKRGYENGEQTIEIYEGKVDVVLYNDKPNKPSFYFYRFDSQDVFGRKIPKQVSLVHRHEVEPFLKANNMDYDDLLTQLLNTAWQHNMNMRDEM